MQGNPMQCISYPMNMNTNTYEYEYEYPSHQPFKPPFKVPSHPTYCLARLGTVNVPPYN